MRNLITALMLILLSGISYAQQEDAFAIELKKDNGLSRIGSISKTTAEIPNYGLLSAADHRYEIISLDESVLYSSNFAVPLASVTTEQGSSFVIYAPFFEDAASIVLYDSGNNVIDSLQLQADFESPLSIAWIYWIAPIAAGILFLVFFEISRLRQHNDLEQSRLDYRIIGIQNFILLNLRKGFSKDQIRNALLKKYSKSEIDKAFGGIK
ncbi:hypothetical protein HYX04_05475 [Candidatus Woesearchaeota archaeon]|nr:hypothetical protein [Candidatus Woesearchaeota archaeon]